MLPQIRRSGNLNETETIVTVKFRGLAGVLQNVSSEKNCKIHRKTLVVGSKIYDGAFFVKIVYGFKLVRKDVYMILDA